MDSQRSEKERRVGRERESERSNGVRREVRKVRCARERVREREERVRPSERAGRVSLGGEKVTQRKTDGDRKKE